MSVRWSLAAALTRSRLPQLIGLVPIVGYAIVWGEQVQGMLMNFPMLGQGLWFSPMTRLQLVYYGGVVVLAGWLVFLLACPRPIRLFPLARDYVRDVFESAAENELEKAFQSLDKAVGLEKLKSDPEGPPVFGRFSRSALTQAMHLIQNADHRNSTVGMPQRQSKAAVALAAYYDNLNRGGIVDGARGVNFGAFSVLLLYGVGGMLFILPSIEVALMVFRASLPGFLLD